MLYVPAGGGDYESGKPRRPYIPGWCDGSERVFFFIPLGSEYGNTVVPWTLGECCTGRTYINEMTGLVFDSKFCRWNGAMRCGYRSSADHQKAGFLHLVI